MDSCNIISNFQQQKRSRLVFFPLPFQGHISPMIQLAKILHSKGFDISIIHTEYNFPDPSKYPHFTFHLISDGLSETEISTIDPIRLLLLLVQKCVQSFRECLGRLIVSKEDSSHQIVCLVTDAIWYFTQAVADEFKLPRIVLRTSSVCSFLAFNALPLLREKGYFSNMDSKMEDEILELPPLKVMDIPAVETVNTEDIHQMIGSIVEATKKASGLIFNTFKELEEPELAKLNNHFLMPIFPIGPFHKRFSAISSSLLTQDRSSIAWLDTQAPKSVLYVSFGSIAAIDSEKLVEMALGLANTMQPFLWAVRPGLVHGSEWLEMLPDGFWSRVSKRAYIVKWAPQQEVLSHPAVGGFWTHSGWNSTLESICEGIPMMCSPFLGDQMVNARYVSDVWRIGIRLERGMERGEIEDAIRRLMVERAGDEMRRRVECLKERVDPCLDAGGSSDLALDGLINLISSFKSSV